MKREIKFRFWDTRCNKMSRVLGLGIIYESLNEDYRIKTNNDNYCINWDTIKIMQYTGLKDKQEKEIYEGDILKDAMNNIMKVSWNQHYCSFCLDKIGWMYSHYFGEAADPEHLEIIGNVFENPELLNDLK